MTRKRGFSPTEATVTFAVIGGLVSAPLLAMEVAPRLGYSRTMPADPSRGQAGGASAFHRSAAGVVALYNAAVYDADEVERGIASLRKYSTDIAFSDGFNHYFYAQYYAAQAMWIRGGHDWASWYASVRDELLLHRSRDGAWHDRVCEEYATAMALLV
jgi:hypothetical protein